MGSLEVAGGRLQTILVTTDGSDEAERAHPLAATLARTSRARLIVFQAVLAHDPLPRRHPGADVAARDVQSVGDAGQARRVRLDTLDRGAVARAIVQIARDTATDVIVMATHGRAGLKRRLLGSVADAVLREAGIPIVLVPVASGYAWPESGPRRILVVLDGTRESERILGPAMAFAQSLGADVILLGVVKPSGVHDEGPRGVTAESRVSVAAHAIGRYLTRVADASHLPQLPRVDVRSGEPAAMIAAVAATEHVDLIAMAAHCYGRLGGSALGSVGLATLRRSDRPLLTVQPPL